jgi:uncharacterized protein YcbX
MNMQVTRLWRYPVKSMRGEELGRAQFGHGGIPLDRRFALVDDTPNSSRRGMVTTATQFPNLIGYAADGADGSVVVAAPGSAVTVVTDAALMSRLANETGLRFTVRDEPGGANHDEADVLVINEASVRQLEREWGRPVDIRRFRANVAVGGESAFEEESWVGRRLQVGGAVLEVVSRCERCSITTVDPETLAVDPSFLKVMAQFHRACFGVYCAVAEPGSAGVGDECALVPESV